MARILMLIAAAMFIIALPSPTYKLPSPTYKAAVETLAQSKKVERIAITELTKKLGSGEKFLLIDVREEWELEEHGAIPGALHIPVSELDDRMKDIPKGVGIVFY